MYVNQFGSKLFSKRPKKTHGGGMDEGGDSQRQAAEQSGEDGVAHEVVNWVF